MIFLKTTDLALVLSAGLLIGSSHAACRDEGATSSRLTRSMVTDEITVIIKKSLATKQKATKVMEFLIAHDVTVTPGQVQSVKRTINTASVKDILSGFGVEFDSLPEDGYATDLAGPNDMTLTPTVGVPHHDVLVNADDMVLPPPPEEDDLSGPFIDISDIPPPPADFLSSLIVTPVATTNLDQPGNMAVTPAMINDSPLPVHNAADADEHYGEQGRSASRSAAVFAADRGKHTVINSLLATIKDDDYKIKIIKSLADIKDAGIRSTVATLAQSLFTESMSVHHKINIIKVLAKIQDKYPNASIVALALDQPLFTESMGVYDKIQIIEKLAKIKDEKTRTSAVTLAQTLFTESMGVYDKINIIENLAKIKDEKIRTSAVTLAQPLFTESMGVYDKINIIESLAKIKDEKTAISTTALAPLLFREGMSVHHKINIIKNLAKIQGAGIRISVTTLAQPFIREGMGFNSAEYIIGSLGVIQSRDERQAFSTAAQTLITPRMNADDVARILWALHQGRVGQGINVTDRAAVVLAQIDIDMGQGLRTEEVFARTIQLIANPETPFTREARVVAQEALTAERRLIYDAYKDLASNPQTAALVAKNLPTDESEFKDIMSDVTDTITAVLKQKDLSDKERFRLNTAIQGVDYALRIRPDFKGERDLPTLGQVFGLLYKTLDSASLNDQIKIHSAMHFQEVQNLFPKDAGIHMNAGLFLESPEGINFIKMIQDEIDHLKTALKPRNMRWIQRARATARLNVMSPLVEALFMAMRGHNINLLSPAEPNRKACADGVYLGAMRALSEVPSFMGAASGMQAVEVVDCG
jgi:hypothetical protein